MKSLPTGPVLDFSISPNEKYITSCYQDVKDEYVESVNKDYTLKIWDFETGKLLKSL